VTYSFLIDGFCKELKLDKARKLFYEMPNKNICPNVVTRKAIIDGFCKGRAMEGSHQSAS
jgi:pentatricopeptide repeat protein